MSSPDPWAALLRRAKPRLGDDDGGDDSDGNNDGDDTSNNGDDGDPTSEPNDPEDAPTRLGTDDDTTTDTGTGSDGVDHLGPLLGEDKDIDTFPDRGVKANTAVRKAITDKEPDVDVAALEKKLKDGYTFEKGAPQLIPDDKDLPQVFQDLNKDITAKQRYGKVTSLPKQEPRADSTVPQNAVVADAEHYDQDAMIVGENRFVDHDTNKDDAKVRPSDITFLMWKQFASHKNANGKQMVGTKDLTSELDTFIGRKIQSRSTVKAMLKAMENTKQDVNKPPGVFKRDDPDPTMQTEFNRLCGTDFISSLSYMFKDHHSDLANKEVKEIWVWPRAFKSSGVAGEAGTGRQQHVIAVRFGQYVPDAKARMLRRRVGPKADVVDAFAAPAA